jgi:hypothetical protein
MVKKSKLNKSEKSKAIALNTQENILHFDPLKTLAIQDDLKNHLDAEKAKQELELSRLSADFQRKVESEQRKIAQLESDLARAKKFLREQGFVVRD